MCPGRGSVVATGFALPCWPWPLWFCACSPQTTASFLLTGIVLLARLNVYLTRFLLQVGRVLLEAVSLSVAAELHRRLDASAAAAAAGGGGRDSCDSGGEGSSQAARCVEVCRTAKELAAEEHMWTRWV